MRFAPTLKALVIGLSLTISLAQAQLANFPTRPLKIVVPTSPGSGSDTTARYVGFECADDYYNSIDMPTALHPQTQLTLTYDGKTLPAEYGFPMKLRMPTKLGYKNPKHITAIFVTNDYPGGYWEDQGYNWFGGS